MFPTIYTLTTFSEGDDFPIVSICLSVSAVMEEMNNLVHNTDFFMPLFLDSFKEFKPNITEKDIRNIPKPFTEYMASFHFYHSDGRSLEEFIEEELNAGKIFMQDHEFVDITAHAPRFFPHTHKDAPLVINEQELVYGSMSA